MRSPPYQGHSDTSLAAANSIEPNAHTLRAAVYRHIFGRGRYGATDEEISDALAMPGNTERPRRVELVNSGDVQDSNRRRATRSGRQAVVWIACRAV